MQITKPVLHVPFFPLPEIFCHNQTSLQGCNLLAGGGLRFLFSAELSCSLSVVSASCFI
uniref:Uncharacterized protein n=1 Tax=Anguilla anguilla TaxID=7936 RepID=A0A0E9T5M4_ANGAN